MRILLLINIIHLSSDYIDSTQKEITLGIMDFLKFPSEHTIKRYDEAIEKGSMGNKELFKSHYLNLFLIFILILIIIMMIIVILVLSELINSQLIYINIICSGILSSLLFFIFCCPFFVFIRIISEDNTLDNSFRNPNAKSQQRIGKLKTSIFILLLIVLICFLLVQYSFLSMEMIQVSDIFLIFNITFIGILMILLNFIYVSYSTVHSETQLSSNYFTTLLISNVHKLTSLKTRNRIQNELTDISINYTITDEEYQNSYILLKILIIIIILFTLIMLLIYFQILENIYLGITIGGIGVSITIVMIMLISTDHIFTFKTFPRTMDTILPPKDKINFILFCLLILLFIFIISIYTLMENGDNEILFYYYFIFFTFSTGLYQYFKTNVFNLH